MLSNRQLEELLESDDELPCACEEIPDTPAYLNDNRFDIIEFPWIENKTFFTHCDSTNCDNFENTNKCEPIKKGTDNDDIIVRQGLLTKQDVFCLKCIADNSSDDIFLWFLNFILLKDMQADYKFLKSCLISDATHRRSYKSTIIYPKKESTFEIIVKM